MSMGRLSLGKREHLRASGTVILVAAFMLGSPAFAQGQAEPLLQKLYMPQEQTEKAAPTSLQPRPITSASTARRFKTIKIAGFCSFVLPGDKLFMGGNPVLGLEADARLSEVLPVLENLKNHPITINVHSDNMGFSHFNDRLTEKRGELLRDWFLKHGHFDPEGITVVGHGGSRPLEPNQLPGGKDNPAGRAANRRVEIVVETLAGFVSSKEKEARRLAAAAAEEESSCGEKDKSAKQPEVDVSKLPPELQELHQIMNPDKTAAGEAEPEPEPPVSDHTPDGRRKIPELSAAEKEKLKKETEWARKEFGLFQPLQ